MAPTPRAIQTETIGPVITSDAVASSAATGVLLWNGSTWSRWRGEPDNADGLTPQAAGMAGRVIGELWAFSTFGGSHFDRMLGDATNSLRVNLKQITVVQAASPAANTAATLTLPAPGANLFHYITHIYMSRHATAALAGGATLAVTTTNLNGMTWRTGNQASILVSTADGMILTDADYHTPIRSAVANTASTIVMPAPGAAVLWTGWCSYYIGPA